jgi:hypothetical protein
MVRVTRIPAAMPVTWGRACWVWGGPGVALVVGPVVAWAGSPVLKLDLQQVLHRYLAQSRKRVVQRGSAEELFARSGSVVEPNLFARKLPAEA